MKTTEFTPDMAAMLSHYMEDPTRNKTAAYKSVYDTSGCTLTAINSRAKRAFKHPIVEEAVKHLAAETLKKVQVDAQYVTDRLQLLAEFNIGKFIVIDEAGNAHYDFRDATEEDWYCIDEYTVDTNMLANKSISEKVRIKATPRLAALKTLGELASVAAFRDNVKISGEITHRNFNEFYDEDDET